MPKRKIKFINADQLTNCAMVCGRERKITKVIDFVPVVKEWVGIGWVTITEEVDLLKYPLVRRSMFKDLLPKDDDQPKKKGKKK